MQAHTQTRTHTLPLLLDSSLAMTQVAHGKHQASQSCSTGSSVGTVCLPLPVTSALAACCTLYKKMRISLESCNQPRFCYPWFVFVFFTLRRTHTYLHQLWSWIYVFPACCYDASFSCVMRKQARVYNAHHHNTSQYIIAHVNQTRLSSHWGLFLVGVVSPRVYSHN